MILTPALPPPPGRSIHPAAVAGCCAHASCRRAVPCMAHHSSSQFSPHTACSLSCCCRHTHPFRRCSTSLPQNCVLMMTPDGRSRGAAMVIYEKWGQVELAVEGENGSTNLGGTKPLVVRIADPPKREGGPLVGIAPRKLFVGQVAWRGCRQGAGRMRLSTRRSLVHVHVLIVCLCRYTCLSMCMYCLCRSARTCACACARTACVLGHVHSAR